MNEYGETRTLSRSAALVFGVIYTLVGIAGFFVTGLSGEGTVLGFDVNALHNAVHLLIGVAGIVASRAHRSANLYLWIVGVTYLLLGVLGLVTDHGLDFIHDNPNDTFLHLASGAVMTLVAAMDRRRGGATTSTTA